MSDPRDDYGTFSYPRPRLAPPAKGATPTAAAAARVRLRHSLFSMSDPLFDYTEGAYERPARKGR